MTLTQAAIFTKRFIFSFIALSILALVGFIAYKIWYTQYLASLPKPVEKPTVSWGALPALQWPTSSITANNFSYSIDTISGLLSKEELETISKVYFIPKGILTLLSSQRSDDLAYKFGITNQPEILSEIRYRYKNDDKILTIDLDSNNFNYTKNSDIASMLIGKGPTNTSSDKIVKDFKAFLNNQGLMKSELQNGPAKVIFLKLAGNQLIAANSPTEAQAFQVSIWPQDLNDKSIVTPNVNKSLVDAVVINSAENFENYLSLNYTYWPVDTSTFSTYPVKSADQALEDLKAGKGVILLEPGKPQVSITSVRLSYYQAENYTPYLQPIFVFEGPFFVAYVPAITEQYLNQTR